jgi:fucose permease
LVLVGANQADLAEALALDLSRSGLLASVLALGIGVGVAGSGPLVDRLPRRPLFAGAALLAAGALFAFDGSAGFGGALALLALLGLAIGVHETLLNACLAELHGARAARALLVTHAGATLGAVLAPLVAGWLAAHADWTASFRATGAAQLALAVAALRVSFPAPSRAGAALGAPPRAGLSPALVPFLAVGFAYVGVESALTVFAVPYATLLLGEGEAAGRAAISAFWLGLLGGRLALLGWRGEIGARLLVAAGLAGALLLAIGVAARLEIVLVWGATGFALGLVFPVMIALAAARFPEVRGSAVGLVAGAGALGGFAVPWLHGALGDRVGLAAALLWLAPWCAALALAALCAARPRRR